jgi:hypothetical protein
VAEDLGDLMGVLKREEARLAAQLKRQKVENRDAEAALTEEIDAIKHKKTSIRQCTHHNCER